MINMFNKLIKDQTEKLDGLGVDGHFYELVEALPDRAVIMDITKGKENGECFEEINFSTGIINESKVFQYKNGKYII